MAQLEPDQVIACNATPGSGGLGQHLAQLIADGRGIGASIRYYTSTPAEADRGGSGVPVGISPYPLLAAYTPVRFSPGWRSHLVNEFFDRGVARLLGAPVDVFVGFGGQCLRSFRRSRQLGASRLELQAANSHVEHVARRHASARARYPFERSWLNLAQRRKTVAEYAAADVIWVASQYVWDSFVREGVDTAKLGRIHLRPAPRFQPPNSKLDDGTFRVVYVGSVSVMKGVPILIDAFSRFTGRPAELTFVGGVATRGMRGYMERAMARDPRIKVAPGDPLPLLHRADVCVHPTYEDGFAYAPAEAIAAGLPVIVTEDTGMKELVVEGVNGFVVPTGDVDAIVDRLEHLSARK